MPRYLGQARAIRASLKRHRMAVTAVSLGPPFFFSRSKLNLHSPQEAVRSESLQYVHRAIDLASVLDAGLVYVCSMSRGPPNRRSDAIRVLKEAVTECSDYAGRLGIGFAVEPFPSGELPSVKETHGLLAGTGAAKLGMVFDSGHAAISGEDLAEAARLSADRLVHVHLNNNDGLRDLHWQLDRGRLTKGDFRGLMRELVRQGYRGEISVELTKPGRIVGAVEKSRQFVAGITDN